MIKVKFDIGASTGGGDAGGGQSNRGTSLANLIQAGAAAARVGLAATAGQGKLRTKRVSLPPYVKAIQTYATRLMARNMTKTPPTFADWVKSGGQAKFPIEDTGFSPLEATQLGIVDTEGRAIPFLEPGQTELTAGQTLFAHERGKAPRGSKFWDTLHQVNRIDRALERTDLTDKHRSRLEAMRERNINAINMALGRNPWETPEGVK